MQDEREVVTKVKPNMCSTFDTKDNVLKRPSTNVTITKHAQGV